MFSLAKLIVPESNETKEVDVAQTWEVRWHSISLKYSPADAMCSTEPEMEVFTSERAADEFAQSIRNAWQLARIRGNKVSVSKRPLIR